LSIDGISINDSPVTMSATGEPIVRRASLGLELIDELSNASLIGASSVTVSVASAPDRVLNPTTFLIGRSRWVLENLSTADEVLLAIQADAYFSETLQTNQTVATLADPSGITVPSVTAPPNLIQVRLRPRTGYPFQGSLTRVAGSVLLAGAPVTGAAVAVTPRYQDPIDPTVSDPGAPVFHTLTADDGQFVAWLFPNIAQDHPTPVAFDVAVTAGGHTGSVNGQPLVPQTVNGVTIALI
jgi:hypothetical protein